MYVLVLVVLVWWLLLVVVVSIVRVVPATNNAFDSFSASSDGAITTGGSGSDVI